MPVRTTHQCECLVCRLGSDAAVPAYHRRLNLLLSRLNEPQRRWYVATLSLEPGSPPICRLSEITGLDEKTDRGSRTEIEEGLTTVPEERQRRKGGGRPPVEKKTVRSNPT